MNKKILLASMGGLLVLVLGFVGVAHAQQFRSGNNATVAANETLNSSAYLAGSHVDVAGTVNGDLYCAGQDVNVSGTVNGDVICAGQTVNISGKVNGSVRVLGQSVTLDAHVKNNLTVGAQDFVLGSAGSIGGDVTGGVSNFTLNGRVGRDIVLAAQDAAINGFVGRNIKSQVRNLNLDANAVVGGNIDYTSANEVNRVSGAVVKGNILLHQPVARHKNFGWGTRLYVFLAMIVFALVLALLFPSLFNQSAKRTFEAPGKTLLLGVAATLFTPIVFVLLMVTLIGIPLGILLLLSWIVALMLSGVFFSFLVGRLAWRGQKNHIWTMLVGSAIMLVLYNVPILGFFAVLAAVFMGMGMIVREITHRTPKPNYTAK